MLSPHHVVERLFISVNHVICWLEIARGLINVKLVSSQISSNLPLVGTLFDTLSGAIGRET